MGKRNQVSVVLGIPTVKRDKNSYLYMTLKSIFDNLSESDALECLVVVLVAETEKAAALSVTEEIKGQFKGYVDSGLLEVISIFNDVLVK